MFVLVFYICMYHETVGEDLDAVVAERSGGELEVAEMAAEDLGGHGGDVVEQVNNHRGRCELEENVQLQPCCRLDTTVVREFGV